MADSRKELKYNALDIENKLKENIKNIIHRSSFDEKEILYEFSNYLDKKASRKTSHLAQALIDIAYDIRWVVDKLEIVE